MIETVNSNEFAGKSDSWDKLENWVDQYKRDSEFWGVGTGPIFTVHQGANGNVLCVSVNEDEITKRNRVRAWSLEQKEAADEYMDLNSKISRAKLIAREVEAGERMLPRNSSVAKFLVEGKKLSKPSFVDGLGTVSLWGGTFVKLFPRIGFTVLCGCCVLWAVTKLFAGNDGAELTREEVEMLRRKKKLRMERAELEKGSIEVIQNAPESPVGSTNRPQLDRGELMKSIMQANASRKSLTITDSLSRFNANDHDFVDKVREIRQMARQARELERQDRSENGKEEEGDDASSILSAAKGKDVTYVEAESLKNGSDHGGLSEPRSPVVQAVDVENKKRIIENGVDSIRDTPDVTINGDDHKTAMGIPMGAGAENSAHCSHPNSPSVDVLRNERRIGQNEMESNILGEKESSGSPSYTSGRISVRRKPKIIRSVKDARVYLAEKRRISTEEVRHSQEVKFKRLPTSNDGCGSTYDDKTNGTISKSIKAVGPSKVNKLREDDAKSNKLSVEIVDTETQGEKRVSFQCDIPDGKSEKPLSANGVAHTSFLDDFETTKMVYSSDNLFGSYKGNTDSINDSRTLRIDNSDDEHIDVLNQTRRDSCTGYTVENKQASESQDTFSDISSLSGSSVGVTPGMTESFKEDGVYHPRELNVLSNKGHPNQEAPVRRLQDSIDVCEIKSDRPNVNNDWTVRKESTMVKSSELDVKPDLRLLAVNSSEDSTSDDDGFPLFPERTVISGDLGTSTLTTALDDSGVEHVLKGLSKSETSFPQDSDESDCGAEALPSNTENTWVEKNFQQFDPIIKKIGLGFKENYMVAKERAEERPSLRPEISELELMKEDGELEWMNDESLRKIVFQVRENELAGRDPFHLMDTDDQRAFFEGLERKTEKVNEKLLGLHEWVHSRIENLDYGADGISLDDPLEKIIPRWKGPSVNRDPEFLHKFNELQTGNGGDSHAVKGDRQSSLKKSDDLPNSNAVSPYSPVNGRKKMSPDGASTSPKTHIECSDGSSRPGKKTGKEHWQHTKKWSQGFLDIYNAETDPEIKSIMKDMGKDLDRWITKKEINDVADLMTRIPKKKRRYIEKKMEKLKREMEMFGAQAVVSKYREYSDEKEEDYLWWLDLGFVLCIELYTIEDDIPKVGFYSLEMAADLELNPKQYHVIAFEDPGDSRNFCDIVQAHMDMLESGKAFVVARSPKDAFREAKANGFSVTVIRKGEIKLNVDQTLEEVEEEITEIGSKIYHDKIMGERAVDIRALMKGVMTADKSGKRTSKRMLMKPANS